VILKYRLSPTLIVVNSIAAQTNGFAVVQNLQLHKRRKFIPVTPAELKTAVSGWLATIRFSLSTRRSRQDLIEDSNSVKPFAINGAIYLGIANQQRVEMIGPQQLQSLERAFDGHHLDTVGNESKLATAIVLSSHNILSN
jgi:hypothetical protein